MERERNGRAIFSHEKLWLMILVTVFVFFNNFLPSFSDIFHIPLEPRTIHTLKWLLTCFSDSFDEGWRDERKKKQRKENEGRKREERGVYCVKSQNRKLMKEFRSFEENLSSFFFFLSLFQKK